MRLYIVAIVLVRDVHLLLASELTSKRCTFLLQVLEWEQNHWSHSRHVDAAVKNGVFLA
jgi:hypothetical protein